MKNVLKNPLLETLNPSCNYQVPPRDNAAAFSLIPVCTKVKDFWSTKSFQHKHSEVVFILNKLLWYRAYCVIFTTGMLKNKPRSVQRLPFWLKVTLSDSSSPRHIGYIKNNLQLFSWKVKKNMDEDGRPWGQKCYTRKITSWTKNHDYQVFKATNMDSIYFLCGDQLSPMIRLPSDCMVIGLSSITEP